MRSPIIRFFILLGLFFPALASAIMPQVAAGLYHSIGLSADGNVYGWGDDTHGQLGLGRVLMADYPQPVSGFNLGPGVVKSRIAVGSSHNVVVRSDGSVWAWGANSSGQLGVGTAGTRTSPVQVVGLTSVVAVAAGADYSLAVKSDGSVWAWGANYFGQLGDGTTILLRASPVQVMGLTGVVAVAAGADHSLAIKSDGSVWAWGYNGNGALGDGTFTTRISPVQVVGLTGVATVACGSDHSLAMKSDGTVWAWGINELGALGTSPSAIPYTSSPILVAGLTGVVALAAGLSHSLALKSDGSVWAWGTFAHGMGHTTPVLLLTGSTVALAAAAQSRNSLVVTSDGDVWAWGSNDFGQLGDGTTMNRSSPVQVPGPIGMVAVAAGNYHTLVLKSDGSVWAWGSNDFGRLGDGSTTDRSSPVQVWGLTGVGAVAAGSSHSLALKSDGSIWAWGDNHIGQLGNSAITYSLLPIQVPGLSSVVAVAAGSGSNHSLAVKSDGSVWAWGANQSGQLGDGTTTNRSRPMQVPGLTGVVAVAIGWDHNLAVKSDGSVWTWGWNHYGQLGDGTTTDRSSPVQVPGLTGVVAVAAGSGHSLAVKSDGSVWAWGANDFGQLGDGTMSSRLSPVAVPGLTGVTALAGGYAHSLAVKSDGSVWAWGYNGYGELGDGSMTDRSIPVLVANLNLVATPQVIEFYNTNLDHYFITADSSEAAAIDGGSAGQGWSRTGNSFKSGGSSAVCRFYGSPSPGPNSHFYTVDAAECANLRQLQGSTPATQKRWNFESLDFVSTPPTNGTCPTGTTPVYRAYNNGFSRGVDSNHRITGNSVAIQEVVARGWINEGVVMCAPN